MKMMLSIVLLLVTSAFATRNLHAVQESVSPVSVQRTKDCPSGSELIGKQCVSIEFLQPNLVCPPGTTLLNGECATFARATRICTKGSTLSSGQCTATEFAPTSFVCDQGEVQGKQCRITTEVPPVCPSGLQLRDGQCVRFTPQQKVCAAGYQLQGKECAKQVTFAASPVCPSDFSLIGDAKCTKSIPVPPRCNSGYSLVGFECIKQAAKIDAPCPHSYSIAGSQCQRTEESPVRPVCPSEFVLDSNNQCIQEIPVPSTCPSGTSRGSFGQCERPVAKRPICDSEEQLVGGRCKRTTLFASELRCAAGYSLIHGKCKKVSSEIPVPRCSAGVLKDNQCITEASSTPLLQCPDGYQLAKGPKCVKDVAYDCSKSIVKTECEMPAFVAELSGLRKLNADYKVKAVPISGKSAPVQVESKTPKCASVTQIVPQTCTKSEAVPVQYVCANGSAPIGKNCPVVQSTPTEAYCKVGQLDQSTGQCITIDIKPSNRVCSIGQLQPDGNCLLVDEKPATLICPEGSQQASGKDGSCVVVQPEVVHPNRVVRRSPQEVCDIGTKQGKVCVQTERVPREKICPSGTEDRDGRCVLTSPVITPEPLVVTRPASYICADGSAANGKSCFTREAVPAEYVCRDGGVREGSRCVHTADLIYPPARVAHAAARPVCPNGFQQQGKQCSFTSSQPAELQCPANYIRYKDGAQECTRAHPRVSVCPAGTQQTDSGCVKKSYTPPRVTEVKVCTKGQSGC